MTPPLEYSAVGTLIVRDGKLLIDAAFPGRRPVSKPHAVPRSVLEPSDDLDGREATVVWNHCPVIVKVTPVRVRHRREVTGPTPLAGTGFLNPYAFVSIPDRTELPQQLADRAPVGHHYHASERWSGTLAVTITTMTPMLIPDQAVADNGPLPVRVDQAGRPLLAGSAVKGMLRSAYEMVTNSRFGVFTGHDQQLAIRANADETIAISLRPAVVTAVNSEGDTAVLRWVEVFEPADRGVLGRNARPTQPTVLVPIGHGRHQDERGRRWDERGVEVEAWLELTKLGKFPHWRVIALAAPGELGKPPTQSNDSHKRQFSPIAFPPVHVQGRLHWTGSRYPADPAKDKRKHEHLVVEKVLSDQAVSTQVPSKQVRIDFKEATVGPDLIAGWCAVIDSFVAAHQHETADERAIRYGSYVTAPDRWKDLRVGDTLFVELDQNRSPIALYPAMISRKPFPGPPSASLPESHRPALRREELSPADRVFGWVRQGNGGQHHDGPAYRGHLRVLPPDEGGIPGADAVRRFDQPLTLVPLNGPNPAQYRFYLADAEGSPLAPRLKDPAEGYPSEPGERRLRGRKIYLTHAEVLTGADHADQYWTPPRGGQPIPLTLASGARRYREYVAAPGTKEAVSTRISQWVRPGTRFDVTLQVDNLDDTELGALLWLLTLPEGAALKLGLGKPLGFGAVRVEIAWDRSALFTGDQLLDRYRRLSPRPEPTGQNEVENLATRYDTLMRQHLDTVRQEFLTAAFGFTGAPVHYPRLGGGPGCPSPEPSAPRAETYDWWTENDRVTVGEHRALGELTDPSSMLLPYLPNAQR